MFRKSPRRRSTSQSLTLWCVESRPPTHPHPHAGAGHTRQTHTPSRKKRTVRNIPSVLLDCASRTQLTSAARGRPAVERLQQQQTLVKCPSFAAWSSPSQSHGCAVIHRGWSIQTSQVSRRSHAGSQRSGSQSSGARMHGFDVLWLTRGATRSVLARIYSLQVPPMQTCMTLRAWQMHLSPMPRHGLQMHT